MNVHGEVGAAPPDPTPRLKVLWKGTRIGKAPARIQWDAKI